MCAHVKEDSEHMDRDQMLQMMTHQTFARNESGRFFVAVSLDEAEAMRVVIHSRSKAPDKALVGPQQK